MLRLRPVVAGLTVLFGAAACDASRPCVYTARLFHAEASCLDPYAPIGLVQAEALDATCPGVCLQQGAELYVSSVCGPYPSTMQVLDPLESADCADALALLGEEESACE